MTMALIPDTLVLEKGFSFYEYLYFYLSFLEKTDYFFIFCSAYLLSTCFATLNGPTDATP